jgi:hypothetical protein
MRSFTCRSAFLYGSALSLIGGVHIGARELLYIDLIGFGYIARLSQWGGRGILPVEMISSCLLCA